MDIQIETVNDKQYKVLNGTYYDIRTKDEVCHLLSKVMNSKDRVILDYGDTETGRSWGEINDIRGTIGRSTGITKIPLLIKTTRSIAGVGILDYCILKVVDAKTKLVLYQHPTYFNH